jgi:chemotaxis protein MotA
MDTATVIGLALGWGGVLLGAIHAGIDPLFLLNFEAFFIVICGTLGAVFISFPLPVILNTFWVGRHAFFTREVDYGNTINQLVGFATKARREGLLGLEEDVNALDDKFLQRGMQLVVDGTDIELVRNIMETDLEFLGARHRQGENIFAMAGGYAPTLGIIGAVIGLMAALKDLDPNTIGRAIATAFVATLYGIGSANLLFLPIGTKLKIRSGEEILLRQMIIEGVCSISAGENPRIVEEKLKAFLPPKLKALTVAAGGGKGGVEEASAAPAAQR